MSTKSTKRVVGWFYRDEWKAVYWDLFADDPVLQKHALDKIAVWKCRSLHRLSTAIECSAELVRSRLLNLEQCNTYQVRLAMSMAVIRFVNLITEKYQNRSVAQPVHHLADELGLPEWLVDMRHDATHSSLPSLPVLQTAVSWSLQWLQENYWLVQLHEDSDSSHTSPTRQKPVPLDSDKALLRSEQLLQEYWEVQQLTLSEMQEEKPNSRMVRHVLNDIERLAISNRKAVLEVLVQDGFLISTAQKLRQLGVDAKDLLNSEELHVPREVIETWRPLLRLLHHLKVTANLLNELSAAVTEDTSLRNRLLTSWLALLLKNCAEGRDIDKTERIYSKGSDVNYRSILETIVKSPNSYTPKLLTCILSIDSCGLDESQQNLLQQCVDKYTQVTEDTTLEAFEDKIFTIQDLTPGPEMIENYRDSKQNNTNDETPTWSLAKEVGDWSQYPLGQCPGSDITYTNLELFSAATEDGNDSYQNCDTSMDENCSEQYTQEEGPVLSGAGQCNESWSQEDIQTLSDSIVIYDV